MEPGSSRAIRIGPLDLENYLVFCHGSAPTASLSSAFDKRKIDFEYAHSRREEVRQGQLGARRRRRPRS